jgi:hypothetical protein
MVRRPVDSARDSIPDPRRTPPERTIMKLSIATLVIVSSLLPALSAGPARADADDDAWIKRCVGDNKDEGQTAPVVLAYCTCMNGKMSSKETMSVTAWEKIHKAEAEECSKKAGWVSK